MKNAKRQMITLLALWVAHERDRVEPVVLGILRGERGDMPWTSALSIVHVIPTQDIRNVLLDRMNEVLERNGKDGVVTHRADIGAVGLV